MQRSRATDFPVQKLIPLKGNASGWYPIPGKLVSFIQALMWLSDDGDQRKRSLHHINPTVCDHNAHQWAAILCMQTIITHLSDSWAVHEQPPWHWSRPDWAPPSWLFLWDEKVTPIQKKPALPINEHPRCCPRRNDGQLAAFRSAP